MDIRQIEAISREVEEFRGYYGAIDTYLIVRCDGTVDAEDLLDFMIRYPAFQDIANKIIKLNKEGS